MRRTLADSAERLREKGRETYDAANEAVGRVVDQSRRAAEAGRARVEDAVNEGRAVFAEQMNNAARSGRARTASSVSGRETASTVGSDAPWSPKG